LIPPARLDRNRWKLEVDGFVSQDRFRVVHEERSDSLFTLFLREPGVRLMQVRRTELAIARIAGDEMRQTAPQEIVRTRAGLLAEEQEAAVTWT
jgi:hypothetical protein